MKKSNAIKDESLVIAFKRLKQSHPELCQLLPKQEFVRTSAGRLLTEGIITRIAPLFLAAYKKPARFKVIQRVEMHGFASELQIFDDVLADWIFIETNGHDPELDEDDLEETPVDKMDRMSEAILQKKKIEIERGDLDQKKLVIPFEKKEAPVFDPQPFETTPQPEKVASAGGNVILSSQGKLNHSQTNVSPGAINLNDKMISQFLASIDVENQTKRNYLQGLKKLQEYSATNSEWFTPKGLIAYKEYLKQKGLDTDSINTYIIAVRRLFKYLFNHGLIPFNPVDELRNFRKKKSRRTAFSHAQVKLLLDTIINENRPTVFRDYAMTRLIAKTGLREMSVQNAKIEDIGIKDDQYILWVLVKGHQAKDEFIVLTDGLYEDLQNAIDGRPEGYIFVGQGNKNTGKQLTKKHINRIITSYMRICQIKTATNCVHSLRNFYISETLRQGAKVEKVQLAVHHTDPKTTMGYARDLERVENPVEAFIRNL